VKRVVKPMRMLVRMCEENFDSYTPHQTNSAEEVDYRTHGSEGLKNSEPS
jgi:hypothetical protein